MRSDQPREPEARRDGASGSRVFCSARRRQASFTLAELLVMVAIIAGLAAMALPQYVRSAERARTRQGLDALAMLRAVEVRWKVEDGGGVNYDNSAGLAKLDVTMPAIPSWNAPTATGAGGGSNLRVTRKAGIHKNVTLDMDMDTGNTCAGNAAAAANWGVPAGPC